LVIYSLMFTGPDKKKKTLHDGIEVFVRPSEH